LDFGPKDIFEMATGIIGCCALSLYLFCPLTGGSSSTPPRKGPCRAPVSIQKISVCYDILVQVRPAPGRYMNIQPLSEKLEI